MRLSDATISKKLALAFAGVLVVIAAAGAFTFFQIQDAKVLNTELSADWDEDTEVSAARWYLARQENSLRGWIVSGDTYYQERLEAHRENFKKRLQAVRELGDSDQAQLQIVQAIEDAADAWYEQAAQRVSDLMRMGATDEAAKLIGQGGQADKLMGAVEDQLDALVAMNDKITTARRDQFEATLAQTEIVSLVSILIAALLAGTAGWLLTRAISRPVRALTQDMERLAQNDLNVEVTGLTRKDEIGAMSRAVQVFKDNAIQLRTATEDRERMQAAAAEAQARDEARRRQAAEELAVVVDETGRGLSALAKGDLTYRIEATFNGDYRKLKDDFNSAVVELEAAMDVIRLNAGAMQSGAGEISQAADDLSRRTEQQAATLEETAAALDEITATVRRTAAGAQRANGVVVSAKTAAEQSGTVVSKAVEAMGDIARSAEQISQIIGVIDEIAFQTNLLALNAGVEAARAGDAGRGFAVVASEVRALAQRSAEAAKEIKSLISASTAQVKTGVSLVDQTGEALTAIVERVSEINGLMGEITASAQEQATALGQVNTAVNQMDQTTQQNAAMVEESTAASHNLAQEAEQLMRLVGRFTVAQSSKADLSSVTRLAPKAAPSVKDAQARVAEFARSFAPAPARRAAAATAAAPAAEADWEEF